MTLEICHVKKDLLRSGILGQTFIMSKVSINSHTVNVILDGTDELTLQVNLRFLMIKSEHRKSDEIKFKKRRNDRTKVKKVRRR